MSLIMLKTTDNFCYTPHMGTWTWLPNAIIPERTRVGFGVDFSTRDWETLGAEFSIDYTDDMPEGAAIATLTTNDRTLYIAVCGEVVNAGETPHPYTLVVISGGGERLRENGQLVVDALVDMGWIDPDNVIEPYYLRGNVQG